MDEAFDRRRPGRPVLIVGAGSLGEIAVREMLRNRAHGLRVTGFADDDPLKVGRRLHGYAVLGHTTELQRLRDETAFTEIVIATGKLSAASRERVEAFCRREGIPVREFRVAFETTDRFVPVERRTANGLSVVILIPLLLVMAPGCAAKPSRPLGAADPVVRKRVIDLIDARRAESERGVNYEIGSGDLIDVRVAGMEELTGAFSVTEEGAVAFPLIGSVRLAGLTERQATEELRSKITELIVAPEVTVAVREYQGRKVSVIGALAAPGVYPLKATDETIGDLISEAGGISSDAGTRLYFTPAQAVDEQAVRGSEAAARLGLGAKEGGFRQGAHAVPIDITRLYAGKVVPELDIPLRAGDSILVPRGGEVYVGGWVNQPGAFPLSRALTLSQAIANAGGMHLASSSGPITLQRPSPNNELESYDVDYQSIVDGEEPDLYLDTGDRLEVAPSPVKVVPWAVYAFVKGIFSFGVTGGVSVSPTK